MNLITKPKKRKSPWAVLIAIVLAMIIGSWTGTTGGLWGVTFYSIYDLLGKLFLNALTLIVVPLVSASIITGVARIGGESNMGRLGIKMFSFYILTSLLAILIGLFLVNTLMPGKGFPFDTSNLTDQAQIAQLKQHLSTGEAHSFTDLILQIIPSNVIQTFGEAKMLGLIFFSFIFGFAISKIESAASSFLYQFSDAIFKAMIFITHLVMKVLPLGVFCLVAKVFAETGIKSLGNLTIFFFTVLCGLAIFMFVVLPLLLKFIARVNPINHFRAMMPALITAFSTSSSAASLPITLDCVEKRAGVSNRISSIVIPLGTSINLSGSALYECVAAMFVIQAYGIDLSFGSQLVFLFTTLLTSMGVAGIPSGSLVAIIVILKAMGIPVEGIGLFIAVDRILDMCRTTTNVFSDSVCAVLVAATEGEKNLLQKKKFTEEE